MTVLDKMSMFHRLVLLIAAICMIYILNEWVNAVMTIVGAVVTFVWLALCQVAKDKEVE